jgi:hypothetical protein
MRYASMLQWFALHAISKIGKLEDLSGAQIRKNFEELVPFQNLHLHKIRFFILCSFSLHRSQKSVTQNGTRLCLLTGFPQLGTTAFAGGANIGCIWFRATHNNATCFLSDPASSIARPKAAHGRCRRGRAPGRN